MAIGVARRGTRRSGERTLRIPPSCSDPVSHACGPHVEDAAAQSRGSSLSLECDSDGNRVGSSLGTIWRSCDSRRQGPSEPSGRLHEMGAAVARGAGGSVGSTRRRCGPTPRSGSRRARRAPRTTRQDLCRFFARPRGFALLLLAASRLWLYHLCARSCACSTTLYHIATAYAYFM